MRQIDGVVLNKKQIRLRGGTIIEGNFQEFRLGAWVKIGWDFTKQRPRTIEYAKDVFEGMSLKETHDDTDWGCEEGTICLDHDVIDEICRGNCVS